MLALQKTADREGLELCDVPSPRAPEAGEVTIEVAATGICGSDISIDRWAGSYSAFMGKHLPVTLGHETAGTIIAAGAGVDPSWIGRRVVVNPSVSCGKCGPCQAGDEVGCLDRQAIGMVTDGAFAKHFVAPVRYCFGLPDNVPLELGALVEPLTTGAYALEVAGFKPGDRVIVFGPGPIGQGTAALARVFGAAEVVVVGMRDAARFEALRAAGITQLFDMAEEGAAGRLAEAAKGGFDIAIDATGVAPVINQALGLLRPQGILSVAGMGEEPANVDILKMVKNRLQIRGVSRMPPSVWPKVLSALSADPAAFEPLISHRMPLSSALEAFELCRAGSASKVLLVP